MMVGMPIHFLILLVTPTLAEEQTVQAQPMASATDCLIQRKSEADKYSENEEEQIIFRGDKSDSEFIVDDSKYPAVFPYPKKGSCAATLFDARYALTAAHCFDGKGENNAKPPFKVNINTKEYVVDKVFVNKCFFDLGEANGADLAILHLTEDADVDVYPLYEGGQELGKTFTQIGWGDNGKGGVDASAITPCLESDDKCASLREGQNKVTKIGVNTVSYVFDSPDSGNALDKETIASSGDSGGPAFLAEDGTTYLMGINSGGTCCKYGSKDEYARISSKWSLDWIRQTIEAESKYPAGTTRVGHKGGCALPGSAPPPANDEGGDDGD